MAAKTVGALAYGIELDHSKLPAGVGVARREFNKVKKLMKETETETERLAREQDELNSLYKTGIVPLQAYERRMADLIRQAEEADTVVAELVETTDDFNGVASTGKLTDIASGFDLIGAAVDGVKAGVETVSGFIFDITENITGLNDRFTVEEKLDIAPKMLAGIQHAARLAGLEVDTVNDALHDMAVRVNEAARHDTGEGAEVLKELGLPTEHLVDRDAGYIFLELATAMSLVENQQDKLRMADQLFGGEASALVNVLNQGRDAIIGYGDAAEEAGTFIGEKHREQLKNTSEAYMELQAATEGFWNQLAVVGAPALEEVFDSLTMVVKELSAFITADPKAMQDWLLEMAETFSDIAESTSEIIKNIKALSDRVSFENIGTIAGVTGQAISTQAPTSLSLLGPILSQLTQINQTQKQQAQHAVPVVVR